MNLFCSNTHIGGSTLTAGHLKKGAIPRDPNIVIPKLADYIDARALPGAPGIVDRESKVRASPAA